MTDREKAIVMAYTGVVMLSGNKLGIFYEYIYDKLGHPILTHELASPDVWNKIKEAAKDDFLALCKGGTDQEPMKAIIKAHGLEGRKFGDCPNCGYRMDSTSNPIFCGQCGQKVKWK